MLGIPCCFQYPLAGEKNILAVNFNASHTTISLDREAKKLLDAIYITVRKGSIILQEEQQSYSTQSFHQKIRNPRNYSAHFAKYTQPSMKMGDHRAIRSNKSYLDHAKLMRSRILFASQREVVEIKRQIESLEEEEEDKKELFSSLFEAKDMLEPPFIQSDAEIYKILAALDRIPDIQHGVISHLGQNVGDIRTGSYAEHEPMFDFEFGETEVIALLEAFPNSPPEPGIEGARRKNATLYNHVVKTTNKRIIRPSPGEAIEESPTKKRKTLHKTVMETPLESALEPSGDLTVKAVDAGTAVVNELPRNQSSVLGNQSIDKTQVGGDNSKFKLLGFSSSFPAPEQTEDMSALRNKLFSAKAANRVKIVFPAITTTNPLTDTQNSNKDEFGKMEKIAPKPRGKPLKSTFKKALIQRTEPEQQPPFPSVPVQPPLPNEPIPRVNWYSESGHNQYEATTPHSLQHPSANGKPFPTLDTGSNQWVSYQQPQGGFNNSFPPQPQNGHMRFQPPLPDGPPPAEPPPSHDFAVQYPSQNNNIQHHQRNQSGEWNPFYNNNRGGRGGPGGRGGRSSRGHRGNPGGRGGTQSFQSLTTPTSERYFNTKQGNDHYNNSALSTHPAHQSSHRGQVISPRGGPQQQKGSWARNNIGPPSTPTPFNLNPATSPPVPSREVATISFTTTALRNQAVRNLVDAIEHKPSFVGVSIVEPHLDTTTFKVEGPPRDNLRGKLRTIFPKKNIRVSMT